MKSKLGIAMLILCALSFFTYQSTDKKKTESQKEKLQQGIIIDAINNEPINGVSIALQGNNPKARSDADGKFMILATDNQELVFRHNNYKTQVITAQDAKSIKMEPSTTQQ